MKITSAFMLSLSMGLSLGLSQAYAASSSTESSMSSSTPIRLIGKETATSWQENLTPAQKKRLKTWGTKVESGATIIVETPEGEIDHVAYWPKEDENFWQYAALAKAVPAQATYHFEGVTTEHNVNLATFAWEMGKYEFTRYKKPTDPKPYPTLLPAEGVDAAWVQAAVEGTTSVRDLINTPPADMTPAHLAAAAVQLARRFGAEATVVNGEELAEQYPCVHAVGKSSHDKPQFVEFHWSPTGVEATKSIALVGKGVTFDSGGLDIKPASGMITMKKDMGGAAHALATANMIMALNLPVNLHVFIPTAENAISGKAYHPSDVLTSRKGTTIEIGNTDAEGRLLLVDALHRACEFNPDYIFDFATLTGAARTAVGTEMGALFCNNDDLRAQLHKISETCQDPMWPQPLYKPYFKHIKGKVGDLDNCGTYGYAGHITAALFLEQFITKGTPWVHLDIMAYNTSSTPGRPEGGEAMGVRAVVELIRHLSA